MNDKQPILSMRGIYKSFGAVQALKDVDFDVYPKEICALVGDNGAGKSTLIKIAAGILRADAGEIFFEGQKVDIAHPDDAKRLGIETLYQDLALVDNLDVTANIFLGRERVRRLFGGLINVLQMRQMEQETWEILHSLDIRIDSVKKRAEFLSGGQRQAVALGRAVGWGTKLVILDEPTASLGVKEAAKALELISRMKERGISMVIISHNLQHVFSVADRIVVLRRGEMVGERIKEATNGDEIVGMITGAELLKMEFGS
ncbi:MAG: ATP-binding cassette domain-containing protein [Anaerolineae bacterium]